jgi:hypothetical protein
MNSPEEGEINEGADYTGRVVALDLAFLFNVFLRHGAQYNLKVVQGIPEGANAVAAGILDETLIVVFDTDVPPEILFQDLESHEEINAKGVLN